MSRLKPSTSQWTKILQFFARAHRPVRRSGRGMPTFHRSGAVGGPLRRPVATPASRVWELEQRLQKVWPLGRPGYLGTAASTFRRRPGYGIPHRRQHRSPGTPLCRRSAPPKGGQAAQALGRSCGGSSTKVHVSVDALGNPLRFILTGGQKHDITQAAGLIAGYAGEYVVADKGYDSMIPGSFASTSWHRA